MEVFLFYPQNESASEFVSQAHFNDCMKGVAFRTAVSKGIIIPRSRSGEDLIKNPSSLSIPGPPTIGGLPE